MTEKYKIETLNRYAKFLGFGKVHTVHDHDTGLHAIVAIHNTDAGPAIGGCRLHHYDSPNKALYDCLRLSYMMTMKAAICDLPHGGAKSVIIKPKNIPSRSELFKSFGRFVNQLQGDYVTACDVGTNLSDMASIATQTRYVTNAGHTNTQLSDPAPHTARGVFLGIQAAVEFHLKKHSLNGVHVVIQGAGNVGYKLAELLLENGARVSVADNNPAILNSITDQLDVDVVACDQVYDVPCDVFAPCALGGTINFATIQRLNTKIIAGSANNQLTHRQVIHLIDKKGILYAPDYVINSGGLISAATLYDKGDVNHSSAKIDQLKETLYSLYEQAAVQGKSTVDIAFDIATQKIKNNKTSLQGRRNEFIGFR